MTTRAQLERISREFYDACNSGEVERMMTYLAPDAVHYFPEGGALGVLVGEEIALAWNRVVTERGSRWSLDRVIVDDVLREAALEWTHFKTHDGGHVRGGEFYRFDDDDRIVELRAYYAAPAPDASRVYELGGFDYAGRGYGMA